MTLTPGRYVKRNGTFQSVGGASYTAAISGTPAVGQVLTASATASGITPASATYQWKRDGASISGATASTYTVTVADEGKALTCTITGQVIGNSNTLSVPQPAIPSLPAAAVPIARYISTEGVVVTSGAVSQWADQSGNNRHATQSTAVNRPKVATDPFGRQVIRFEVDATAANSDSLDFASAYTFDARNVSIFVVARVAYAGTAGPTMVGLLNYAGASGHLRFSTAAATTTPVTLYGQSRDSALRSHMAPEVFGMAAQAAGTTVLNGRSVVSGLAAVTADADCLGGTIGRYNTTGFTAMDVLEVFVCPGLSATDAQQVRDHLRAKYGVRSTQWTKNILFEGDSITQGTGLAQQRGYPYRVLRSGAVENWRMLNVGSSGAAIATLTGRTGATDGYQVSGARNVLHFMIGRNDVPSRTAAAIYADIVTYVQGRVTAGWEVWVGTLIATGVALQPTVDGLNALLRGTPGGGTGPGIVSDAGANRVVDYASITEFSTSSAASDLTYYESDDTHPTVAGQEILASYIANILAAA